MSKTASQHIPARVAPRSGFDSVTIGRLAEAAQVGVETVRYYQRRGLLPVPQSIGGGVRRYPAALVDRIRFIKRSQHLGFSLDEIRELMHLEEGGSRTEIRRIAGSRLSNIRDKITDLRRMERVLSQLQRECENSRSAGPCPIIAALRLSASVVPMRQRQGTNAAK
jgi:MerR family transcriptional regulator, mercuric resistance operon regulatory protein